MCPQGTFGHMCFQRCQCAMENVCHPRTGNEIIAFFSFRILRILFHQGECNALSCNGDAKCLVEQQRKQISVAPCPEGE